MAIDFEAIGKRLRAYRLGRGIQTEELAERLGISRAAVYRIESGEVVKIETLDRLSSVLQTSVASLLGAGVEYYSSALSYFERMRQLEEESDQIVAHFAPVSYLLTTEAYTDHLRQTLIESLPSQDDNNTNAIQEIDGIIEILNERRRSRTKRRLSVVNFINVREIERWLKLGVIGRFDLPEVELASRRLAARVEVEHLIDLIEREPMGIQIGLMNETMANTTFQLFRSTGRTLLGLSPFRLGGELPNVSSGVAMLTADAQPVVLYETLAENLWRRAFKGGEAGSLLRQVIARSGAPA